MKALLVHRRAVSLIAGLCCFALLGYAYYAQFQLGLEPCPLCIFERIAIFALGIALLLAALPVERQLTLRRLAAVLVLIVGLAGIGVATRHVYIQSLPPGQVPVCGATLDYMYEVFPLLDVLRKVLTGSGECAKVDWTFLGLAMPAWVLLWAVGLTALGFAIHWRRGAAAVR
ncbi:MAG: disulfide bond formation protein B [Pseudomonadota bacterium]